MATDYRVWCNPKRIKKWNENQKNWKVCIMRWTLVAS